jgi:probable HAF family extracellular repeat protein
MVGIDIGTAVQSAVFWADSQSAPIALTGIDGDAVAADINSAGLIVGTAIPEDGSGFFPVVWSSANAPATFLTEVSDQFPLGVTLSVNAAGNILGDACTPDLSECHVAYWADSTSTPVALASPNDKFSITDIGASSEGTVAHLLNDRGNMVGFATTADFSQLRAVYWESSSSPAVILNSSKDFPNGSAEGINNRGQIVGVCYTRDFSADHAFFWPSPNHPGIDLNTLIPANSGYEIVVARSINDRGEIAGGAFFNGGTVGHAIVLVPVH